jgi:hypothetical protein
VAGTNPPKEFSATDDLTLPPGVDAGKLIAQGISF